MGLGSTPPGITFVLDSDPLDPDLKQIDIQFKSVVAIQNLFGCGGALVLGSHPTAQVGAPSSSRPQGVWEEKIAPVVPAMGMCGPAALDPRSPCGKGLPKGCCLDGGGAGTEFHADNCLCGRRRSGGLFGSARRVSRDGILGPLRGGVMPGFWCVCWVTPCVGRSMRSPGVCVCGKNT